MPGVPVIQRIIGRERSEKIVKSPRLRKYVRRAGGVAFAIIALDLVATAATLALGVGFFKG